MLSVLSPVINVTTGKINCRSINEPRLIAIFNNDKDLQYIGFSKNVHTTLFHMLIRKPVNTYYFAQYDIGTYDIPTMIQVRERLYEGYPFVDREHEKEWEKTVTVDQVTENLMLHGPAVRWWNYRNHFAHSRWPLLLSSSVGLTLTYAATVTVEAGQWFIHSVKSVDNVNENDDTCERSDICKYAQKDI